jgi:hypothetical protein
MASTTKGHLQEMKQLTKHFSLHCICLISLIGLLPSLVSCAHVNVNQIAYEVLRQEDCRRNQLEDFCSRNFASEYHEYERIRQDFIRSSSQPQWRAAIGEQPDQAAPSIRIIMSKNVNTP